ncbi:MAG: lysophospholipid acyltransferase family protein [Elusimicrobiota bacterium]
MLRALIPRLVYGYVHLVGWTVRLRTVGGDIARRLHAADERIIYAFWHQQQVFFVWSHRNAAAAVLVSKSKDGEMIAEALRLFGVETIRGSSSRGGAAAVREMAAMLRAGRDVGITPDGPKGPSRQVKEGVIRLAQISGAPILPIANALSLKLEISSTWDRFQVPLPFSRVAIVHDEPIRVASGDDLDLKAAELKIALDRISSAADRLVH